jgi:hypothetical protein
VPGAFSKEPNAGPDYASTVMMVKDDEVVESGAQSSEAPTIAKPKDAPRALPDPLDAEVPTDRSLPPSPSTPDPPPPRPVGGGDTLESFARRPHRKASSG